MGCHHAFAGLAGTEMPAKIQGCISLEALYNRTKKPEQMYFVLKYLTVCTWLLIKNIIIFLVCSMSLAVLELPSSNEIHCRSQR